MSENNVSENNVSENTVSENTVSENTVSEDNVSENTVSENTVSENTVSENTVQETKAWKSNVRFKAFPSGGMSGYVIRAVDGNMVFNAATQGAAVVRVPCDRKDPEDDARGARLVVDLLAHLNRLPEPERCAFLGPAMWPVEKTKGFR